jgi:hypothetical protein
VNIILYVAACEFHKLDVEHVVMGTIVLYRVNPFSSTVIVTVMGGIIQSMPCNCDHFLSIVLPI